MKAMTGAKARSGERVKPVDLKIRGTCPCNAFLKCSTRPPYGCNVWGDKTKREQAMREIAYSGKEPITNAAPFAAMFKRKRGNPFYRNLDCMINGENVKVMVMPGIQYGDIEKHMANLKVHNKGEFNNFQKSIIARASMAWTSPAMMSNVYVGKTGNVEFPSKTLTPFIKEDRDFSWDVDHIQTRSKGGCNRFCNAGLMAHSDNSGGKIDIGPGCPCAHVKENGQEKVPGQQDFDYPSECDRGHSPKYTLWDCTMLWINHNNDVPDQPRRPPGTIKQFKMICERDNPCDWANKILRNRTDSLKRKVRKYCL